MKFLIIFILIITNSFAEEIKCPIDSDLIDFVLSYSQERMQVCQKKGNGNFVKNGPEIIYNKDGTVKSKKYFELDKEVPFPQNHLNENLADKITENNLITTGSETSGSHTCIILKNSDKNVFCWGANAHGQLGNNSKKNSVEPVMVKSVDGTQNLKNIIGIYSSGERTCGINTSGNVLCWGWSYSQDGRYYDALIPEYAVDKNNKPITGITQLALTLFNQCGINNQKGLICWGRDGNLIGEPQAKQKYYFPTEIKSLGQNLKQIIAGNYSMCTLNKESKIRCWGDNMCAIWGGLNGPVPIPEDLPNLKDQIKLIAIKGFKLVAVTTDDHILVWQDSVCHDPKTLLPGENWSCAGSVDGFKLESPLSNVDVVKIDEWGEVCVKNPQGDIKCIPPLTLRSGIDQVEKENSNKLVFRSCHTSLADPKTREHLETTYKTIKGIVTYSINNYPFKNVKQMSLGTSKCMLFNDYKVKCKKQEVTTDYDFSNY